MTDEWERIWNAAVMAYSKYYPSIFLEILKSPSQDNQCPG
jgi:hypothetical protein